MVALAVPATGSKSSGSSSGNSCREDVIAGVPDGEPLIVLNIHGWAWVARRAAWAMHGGVSVHGTVLSISAEVQALGCNDGLFGVLA